MGFFTRNKDKKKKKSVEALLNNSSNNKDNASLNNDVHDNTGLLKEDLGIPEFNDKDSYRKNINNFGDNYDLEHKERGSYFEDSLNRRSFDQGSRINSFNTLNKNNQDYNLNKIEKEIELLNSKLETIKAMLENISTKIENIEKKNERKMF